MPCARGASGPRKPFTFTFSFLTFVCSNFYLQLSCFIIFLFFRNFVFKIFSPNFYPIIFCLDLLAPKCLLVQKFCTMTFLCKTYSRNFYRILLFRVFSSNFSLKALFRIVCISLVNFLFVQYVYLSRMFMLQNPIKFACPCAYIYIFTEFSSLGSVCTTKCTDARASVFPATIGCTDGEASV